MPDCSAAQLTVGGTVETMEAFDALLETLEDEGCLEYQGPPEDGWRGYLLRMHEGGEPLVLQATSMPGGLFEEVQEACKAHALAYWSADDGHYAYSAQNEAWRPGWESSVVLCGTIDSGPAIALTDIVKWRRQGELDAELARIEEAFAPIPPLVLGPVVLAALTAPSEDVEA